MLLGGAGNVWGALLGGLSIGIAENIGVAGLPRFLILGAVLAAVVLLDEPSLGISPLVVDQICKEIQRMNLDGISFLLVEQNARKGLSISHRGYTLELGQNRMTGTGKELLDNPEVRRLYLGG